MNRLLLRGETAESVEDGVEVGDRRLEIEDRIECAVVEHTTDGGVLPHERGEVALVESGLERDDAYRLVQRNAMRAWDEELDFRELVRADHEISSRVDPDAVFDLDAYTKHVDTVFNRLKEPAHA